MANEVKFASPKSPIVVFVLMVFYLTHNFYLGKPWKAIFLIGLGVLASLFHPETQNSINKTGNQSLETLSYVLIGIFALSGLIDLYRLFNRTLTDAKGRIITPEDRCSNCGYLGEQNVSIKSLGMRMEKVDVEKIVSKTYGDRGRLTGVTKSVTQVDKKYDVTEKTIECPYCGDKRKFDIKTAV
jgi:rubredoxin